MILRDLALEFVLKDREICGPVSSGDHDLAVEDSRARLDAPGVVGDLLESMGPVVTAAGKKPGRLVGKVKLDPVAVELDFVNPASTGRYLLNGGCQRRFDEVWQRRLRADGRCFLMLKRHPRLLQLIQIGTVGIVPEPRNPPLRCIFDHSEEEPMAAPKKKTARGRKQDRARVAGGQKYEVNYESKKTGRSASAVKKAVKKVSNARRRVEKGLGR
jgi:hypothetical protein